VEQTKRPTPWSTHRRGKSVFSFLYCAIKTQTTTDWLLYCVMPLNKWASTSVGQQFLSQYYSSFPFFFKKLTLSGKHNSQSQQKVGGAASSCHLAAVYLPVLHRSVQCCYILLHNFFTYLLSPCSWVLPEKLTSFQIVKKFPAFYGTQRFITTFPSACHLSLSWASSIQPIPPHPTS